MLCDGIRLPNISQDGKPNEVHWDIGATDNAVLPNHVPPPHSIIVYTFCKTPPLCVSICDAKIYYVVHKLPNMTKICIHFDSHNHHVSSGNCHESIEITKELVRQKVEKNSSAATSIIALATSKKIMNHDLFVSSETPPMKLQRTNLLGLMERFFTQHKKSCVNLLAWEFRTWPIGQHLELKKNSLIISKIVFPLDKVSQKFTCSKCPQRRREWA